MCLSFFSPCYIIVNFIPHANLNLADYLWILDRKDRRKSRSRSKERERRRRSRDRSRDRHRKKTRSRSKSRERERPDRERDRSPLELDSGPRVSRRRKISIWWDRPPTGFEHITPLQYKAMQGDIKIDNKI